MKFKPEYPIVQVWWLDSRLVLGWHNIEGYKPQPQLCVTVGYVIADTDAGMVIAASVNDGDVNGPHASGITEIPASVITKRKQIG